MMMQTSTSQRYNAHLRRIAEKNELRDKVLNLKDNHGCSNMEIAAALSIRESDVRGILQTARNG